MTKQAMYKGPAGATEAHAREPASGELYVGPPLAVYEPVLELAEGDPSGQTPHQPPGPDSEDSGRVQREPEYALRMISIYVGAVSADREVGIVSPPVGGIAITRLSFVVRTSITEDGINYWTFQVVFRRPEEQILGELIVNNFNLDASTKYVIWELPSGIMVEPDQEVSVKMIASGAPSTLEDLHLYADLRAGG